METTSPELPFQASFVTAPLLKKSLSHLSTAVFCVATSLKAVTERLVHLDCGFA